MIAVTTIEQYGIRTICSPYMNFGDLSNGTLLNLLNRYYAKGQERFHTVTTSENGFAINGKYSFPGNEQLLNGLNYPFPTVLTQTNSFGKTVNVHYGSWPMLGLYWVENEGTIDLFKDLPQTKAAAAALTTGRFRGAAGSPGEYGSIAPGSPGERGSTG